MEIPGIGLVTKDKQLDWYYSKPLPIPVLDGRLCRFVVEGYDDDQRKEEFHTAIRNFLSIDSSVLKDVEPYIYQYYKDSNDQWEMADPYYIRIDSPGDIWQHIQLGTEPLVTRRAYGDKSVYISLECGCEWEDEHGLQIVFKNGLKVNKIGQFDGHVTNSDAYGDASLENVIYR